MIYTVTLNPARDRTITIPDFQAGKVNRVQALRDDPGGKGINVSKIIHMLGGKSVAMGILGGATGKYLRKCLSEMDIAHDFVLTSAETRTNIKVVDPLRQTTTDINEPGNPVPKRVLTAVFARLTAAVKPGDIAIFAGRIPAGASAGLIADWTRKLAGAGVRVFLDADSAALAQGVEAAPFLIKPNEAELGQLLGQSFSTLHDIYLGARSVIDRARVQFVAVSMGKDGALFVTRDAAYRAEGLRVPVLSTVGAGDAMMGALAYGFDVGMPVMEACRLAIAASAASVMCAGTQSPPKENVDKLFKQARVCAYIPE